MSETRRFTAEDYTREAAEGFDAFGPDFTPTSNMLEQAAESERVLAEFAKLISWLDERRNAPDVTTLGMMQEKVRAILGRVKP